MLNIFDFKSSKVHEQETSENINLFLIIIGLLYFIFDFAIGADLAIIIPSLFVIINVLVRPFSSSIMNKVMVGNLTVCVIGAVLVSGGGKSPFIIWLAILPLAWGAILGRAYIWPAAALATTFYISVLHLNLHQFFPQDLAMSAVAVNDIAFATTLIFISSISSMHQKKEERKSRAATLLFETIEQTHPIAICSDDGEITFANSKLVEDTGIPLFDLIGSNIDDLNNDQKFFVHTEHRPLLMKESNRRVWRGEVRAKRNGSKRYWVRSTLTSILDENNEVAGYLNIRENISEQKKATRTIRKQSHLLGKAARLSTIGELASAVTHEINNPMAIISLSADLAERALEEEVICKDRLKEQVRRIKQTAARVSKIIQNIKLMSHDTSKELKRDIIPKELIGPLIDLKANKLLSKNVDLEIEVDEMIDSYKIRGNATQLQQVVINLVKNAVDAASESRAPKVNVDVKIVNNRLGITVSDNGPGIPQAIRSKIFDPFFTTKAFGKGTGLGLSLSHNIIQDHSGQIGIVETDEKGTKMMISLPTQLNVQSFYSAA